MPNLQDLPNYILAVGALGTAAYGLVDASKAFAGGVSRCGFKQIRSTVEKYFPSTEAKADKDNPLRLDAVLSTLCANWLNGMPLADQKLIAKTLIKLRLDEKNAKTLAEATGVDPGILTQIAKNIRWGQSLDDKGQPDQPSQRDVLGRFDIILSAQLDEGYQRADQIYRNSAKAWSLVASVVLAFVGDWVVCVGSGKETLLGYLSSADMATALIVGLIATPLAPVSKDLASALNTAVKTMQVIRK